MIESRVDELVAVDAVIPFSAIMAVAWYYRPDVKPPPPSKKSTTFSAIPKKEVIPKNDKPKDTFACLNAVPHSHRDDTDQWIAEAIDIHQAAGCSRNEPDAQTEQRFKGTAKWMEKQAEEAGDTNFKGSEPHWFDHGHIESDKREIISEYGTHGLAKKIKVKQAKAKRNIRLNPDQLAGCAAAVHLAMAKSLPFQYHEKYTGGHPSDMRTGYYSAKAARELLESNNISKYLNLGRQLDDTEMSLITQLAREVGEQRNEFALAQNYMVGTASRRYAIRHDIWRHDFVADLKVDAKEDADTTPLKKTRGGQHQIVLKPFSFQVNEVHYQDQEGASMICTPLSTPTSPEDSKGSEEEFHLVTFSESDPSGEL